jgi:hypothetical protein
MSPEESADYLKTDESISNAHKESAQEGQTEAGFSYFSSKYPSSSNKLIKVLFLQ